MDQQFSLVEVTDQHRPAVVELCRVALDLPEDAAEAAEIVACLLDRGPAAPRFAVVAGEALLAVAFGSISDADPMVGHVDLLAVHPRVRRQGLARALLSTLEPALARLGATEVRLAGNPPYYAWPGIDVRYTPAVCAATTLGYVQNTTAWNMTADLSDAGSAVPHEADPAHRQLTERGITVRPAGTADVAALAEFAQGQFGGSWGAEVTRSVDRPGAGCHLATDADGQLLGFAAYGSARPNWFGPMGTAPAAQGLGIGGVLLRRCLRDQAEAGHSSVQIGWAGPVRFYADSVGARIERVFVLYRKEIAG